MEQEREDAMLSRRKFGTCAICAVVGLAATKVESQAQTAGAPKRTLLQKTEFPDKYATILMMIELEPNFDIARHTHPGVESSYVLEGGLELMVQGQPAKSYKAGEGFQVPPHTPHSGKNGDKPTKLIITYVVEADKPIASPAPA